MPEHLQITTTAGPVTGFADTFPLGDESKAEEIARGANGGNAPVLKWLGIPYAHAERWHRPQSPAPWSAPLKCWEFGTKFLQPPSGVEKLFAHSDGVHPRHFITQDEHSHTVNVWAPEGTKAGDDLAVLVWIYGGSLNNGSADRFIYDPTEWIRRSQAASPSQKFIVVSGNYRTNVYGFLSNPDLVAEDPDGLAGNYGLYDCVAMLEWVQANISSFGGSPSRVTVFGESAGAFLVSHLLVSGRKLFQQAIMQSGAPETMELRTPTTSYPAHPAVLSLLSNSYATPSARLAALRALPAEALFAVHLAEYKWGGLSLTLEEGPKATWGEDTLARLRRGEWDPWVRAVVVGTNEHEGSMFSMGMGLTTDAAFTKFVFSTFPPSLHASIFTHYLPTPSPSPLDENAPPNYQTLPGTEILSDLLFVHPAYNLAKALSGTTQATTRVRCAVWSYRCRAEVDRISKAGPRLGAMHTIEIPFVFDTASLFPPGGKEERVAKEVGERWAAFAIDGVPDPNWTPFTPEAPTWLAFADDGTVANELLKGFEAGRVDLTGKGWGAPKLEDLNE